MHTGITEIQWLIFFFQEALVSTHERRVLSVQLSTRMWTHTNTLV